MMGEVTIRRMMKRVVLARALPEEFGGHRFYATVGTDWRFAKPGWTGEYEDLFRVVRRLVRPGSACWDVGANVGVFAFAAAHRVAGGGSVLAVEADPALAAMLYRSRRSLPTDAQARVRILPAALTSDLGLVELVVPVNGSARNHLASLGGNGAWGEYDRRLCVGVTGDWLLEHSGPPAFVKLDIEGAELMFLRGAPRLLSETRPGMYLEVNHENAGEATSLLASLDYALFELSDAGLRPVEACLFNTVALPREKLAAYGAA